MVTLTVLFGTCLFMFFKAFSRIFVKNGQLGVQIANSVWSTVFIGAHGSGVSIPSVGMRWIRDGSGGFGR